MGLFRTTYELLWGEKNCFVRRELEAVFVPSAWPRLVGPVPERIVSVPKVFSPSRPTPCGVSLFAARLGTAVTQRYVSLRLVFLAVQDLALLVQRDPDLTPALWQ